MFSLIIAWFDINYGHMVHAIGAEELNRKDAESFLQIHYLVFLIELLHSHSAK